MIKDEKGFAEALVNVNEWLISGKSRKAERYKKKRGMFERLKAEVKTRRIVILSGPRRVGKSVILSQLIQELIDSGVKPENVVYYQMDDPNLSLYSDEPLKDLIDHTLERTKGRVYFFLDEIQAYKDWYRWIKAYYDRDLDVKFFLSGSSSLTIQADANRYLRGRTAEAELFPLGFREFLFFYGMAVPLIRKKDSVSLALAKKQVDAALEEYLLVGGFPEWFEIKNEKDAKERWLAHLLSDVPKKAIYEDIAAYFNIRNPKLIDLILNIIAVNQSKMLSYESLNEIANVDRATLISYLEFLKSSFLIIDVPVYGSPRKQMKAMKKYLIIDQGLRNSIMKNYSIREGNRGFAVENIVGITLALLYRNISYWRQQNNEVDFVTDDIPIEVKYQNAIEDSDHRGLISFLEKEKGGFGVMITKDKYGERIIEGKRIRYIPFWMFLLDPGMIKQGKRG